MDDPALRGTLTIDDRVGEKIAVRTALGVDGVIEHRSKLGALLSGSTPGRAMMGSDYPSASIDMSSVAPHVAMNIAVRWPAPVTAICQRVRTEVAAELERLTGIRPERVDVSIAAVVPASVAAALPDGEPGVIEHIHGKPVRRGYVVLPPVDLGGESLEGSDELARRTDVWRDRVDGIDVEPTAQAALASSDDVLTDDVLTEELIRGRPVPRGYIVLPPYVPAQEEAYR
ncbi:Asp23/Gls24 family envelope stress response protein [Gordonia sp. CPCC 205515]|uniref:Asp23/Gls24 family envelope stress response protein n=1 Tax=Gordonia sp. CPCC 205515 TaxID=3140791 RepID=UPI003AF364D1